MFHNVHKHVTNSEQFTSMKVLEEHQTHKHSKRFYTCSLCGKEFTNPLKLAYHSEAHTRNRHSCKFCGEICEDQSDLYIHLTTFHKKIDKFLSGVRTKEFERRSILKRHIKRVHMLPYPSMVVKTEFFCSIHSKQESFDDDELQNELLQTDLSRTCSETQVDKMSKGKKIRNKEYFEKSALVHNSDNTESHPNSGYQICSACEKIFTNPRTFVYHEDAHKRNKHSCKFCGEIFNTALDIYIHVSTFHKNVHKVLCDLCSRGFANIGLLMYHIAEVHTSTLPSIIEKGESFCTIHSHQICFDDRELKWEILLLQDSQTFSGTQENDVSGENYCFTGHKKETAFRYGPDNTEDDQLLSNSAKEAETVTGTEQKQEVAGMKCNSIYPDHSDVGHSPHSEVRMQMVCAENNEPYPDFRCTSAGIEHHKTVENMSGMYEQIERPETYAFLYPLLPDFDPSPYSNVSLDTCAMCGMEFSGLNELTSHLISHVL